MKTNIKINAILNVVKRGMSVFFPLITYTYVSRVLGSANLGTYSFSESIVSYFNLIAALGVSSYAIREGARIRENKNSITQFSAEIFTFNAISTISAYALLLLAVIFIPRLREDANVILILSVNILCNTLGRDWLNSIFEDFMSITVRYIIFQSLAVVMILTLVRSKEDILAYTAAMAVAISGAALANVIYSYRKYAPIKLVSPKSLTRHIKPVLYLFLISLTITIYINSDITILGFMRTSSEVGIYTLSSKIYIITKEVLNAITMVAIPRLSNYLGMEKNAEYSRLLGKLREALIIFIFPCIVGIFSLSKQIVVIVGGQEYAAGWVPLTILCGALFFAVFACFYAQGVLVPNRLEKRFLLASTVSAVANILLNLILIPYWGMAAAALTTVVAEFLVMAICLFYSIKEADYEWTGMQQFVSPLAGCVVIYLICSAMKMYFSNAILIVLCSIILSAGCYLIVLIALRNELAASVLLSIRGRIHKKRES